MKRSIKPDSHMQYMRFIIGRINEINEWRQEAILAMPHRKNEIDRRVFELREPCEC